MLGFEIGQRESGAPTAPHVSGACGAHGFKNFRRVIRILNMCLVLKLDNGIVVSIANKQTESWQHPVPYHNIDNVIRAFIVEKDSGPCPTDRVVSIRTKNPNWVSVPKRRTYLLCNNSFKYF